MDNQVDIDLLRLEAQTAKLGILPPNTKFESYIGHTVINISKIDLTEPQLKALGKSLTFCPTPGPPDKAQIWLDFKEFHRRLELTHHFSDNTPSKTNTDTDQSIIDFMNQNAKDSDDTDTPDSDTEDKIKKRFVPKSGWRPYSPNKTLETLQRSFKHDLIKSKITNKRYDNLTKQERQWLQELKSNNNIVIKKSDKGSAVVVKNTTDYL